MDRFLDMHPARCAVTHVQQKSCATDTQHFGKEKVYRDLSLVPHVTKVFLCRILEQTLEAKHSPLYIE